MKRVFIWMLLAQLLLAPAFASALLSAHESAVIQKCRNNVNPERKQLSVEMAMECVKELNNNGAALLNKLKDDNPDETLQIVSRNNALLDLNSIVTKNSGWAMAKHLSRVLESEQCTLCPMGLGPKPENIFNWADKEGGPGLSAVVKESVRTWESLGNVRTGSLSAAEYNYNRDSWNSQPIRERYLLLSKWAAKETDKLVEWAYLTQKKPDSQLISILREDLGAQKNAAKLAKLDKMDADFSKLGGGEGTRTSSAAEKRAQELAGASKSVEGLKGKSESDKAAYLSKTFDQAANNTDGIPMAGGDAAKHSGFVFKELSPEQAAGLAGRLMTVDDKGNLKGPFSDELRGTKAGNEILAFYKDPRYAKDGTNRLKLDLAEHQQAFFPPSKTIYLDREAVNGWMKNNQISPEQLYEGEPSKNPYLQKLSRHMVPTFVHEATHQRQLAKAVSSGMDYININGTRVPPYQMEMETEAFSMEGSFITERLLKRGPAYAGDLDSYEKQKAELFLEKGVEGLRLYNHRTYYSQLDSLEGSVAKEFSTAASMAKTLNGLEAKYKKVPETMGEDELEQMRDLRASIDSRFKWYTTVYADSVAAEAKLNAWRRETTDKLYSSGSLRAKAPPELL